MHHAILAFPGWKRWSDVTGMTDRSFRAVSTDRVLDIRVADPGHPITAGMADWRAVEETYLMNGPDADVVPLLIVDEPTSMPTLAWAYEYGRSRVVTLEPGHGPHAFGHPSFRRFLGQAVRWTTRDL